MSLSESEQKALHFLKSLPKDTEIAWNSRHVNDYYADGPWVDIDCPMLAEIGHWNWCWTIEDPRYIGMHLEAGEELDTFSFILPFDAKLYMHMKPGQEDGVPTRLVLQKNDKSQSDISHLLQIERENFQKNCPDDWEIQMTWAWQHVQGTDPVVDILNKQSHQLYEPRAERIESSKGDVIVTPVWTTQGISKGLGRWAEQKGCNNGVRFVYKKDMPVPEYLQDVIDAADHFREEN